MSVEGALNVLKPAGMTSSDMVSILRRVLDTRKIGHLGTLDPAAAGVLPVLAGRATKLFDLLNQHEKEYVAEFTFGVTTDTLDAQGTVIPGNPIKLTWEAVEAVRSAFVGEQQQIPPMFSAIQFQGQRLYDLARKGANIELQPRTIVIHKLELMRVTENTVTLRVACSKGTYIRSLCRDMAAALGTVGYVSFLLRTCTGSYRLEDSYSVNQLEQARDRGTLASLIQPMDAAIDYLPAVHFPKRYARTLFHGGGLDCSFPLPETDFRAYCGDTFLGVGKAVKRKDIWVFRYRICLCIPPEA